MPLDDLVDWSRVEDFAQDVWTSKGKKYALGMQAFTVELYYNKDLLKKVGVTLPADATLTQGQFLDMVKKARAAGIDPIVQGVGDRPYPGSYILHEQLLRMLGKDDYAKLWAGTLSFKDPRVVKVFQYVKQLVDAGAYPKTFSTLKLGESHLYFHTRPGGLTLPLGSWYASRAFNAPDKGGQPEHFPLGVMQFPKMDGGACPNCKTISVAGSYAINAKSKNSKLAASVLNAMTTPDMANMWLSTVFVQTGAKSGSGQPSGKHASYFRELGERSRGRTWFIGTPIDFITGKCKDTYIQVLNAALPAGLIGPQDAINAMEAACYKP
jgi:multiple sugar transport system substrate-binding protein